MKMINKKTLASTAAVSAIALSAMAPVANAEVEVSASVSAANMYYWRGLDLGGGAAVSGDITVSVGGAYGGMWASSGDGSMGTEYDLFIGYGQSFGDFSFDVSLWNYNYPSATEEWIDFEEGEVYSTEVSPDLGDLMELVVSLGFGPATFTYYHGLEDLEDYWYTTAEVSFGSFGLKYGLHEDDLSHIDLTYAYNDYLSFTLGVVVDDAEETWTVGNETFSSAYNSEPKFIVSLSLPIEF